MPCPQTPQIPTQATHFEKGAMYWFDFAPQDPSMTPHPAVIIGKPNTGHSVIICKCTSLSNVSERGRLKYPYHARIEVGDCAGPMRLDHSTAAQLNFPFTILKTDLWSEWYIGNLNNDTIARINTASLYALDLFPYVNDLVMNSLSEKLADYVAQFSRK